MFSCLKVIFLHLRFSFLFQDVKSWGKKNNFEIGRPKNQGRINPMGGMGPALVGGGAQPGLFMFSAIFLKLLELA